MLKGKKAIASFLALGLTLSVFSSCASSSSAGSSANSTGSTGSAGSASSASAAAVKLELFSTKSENSDTLKELVKAYEAQHSNVTITINSPNDAGTVLKTRLTKNDIPDIVAMGGDATYTEVESAGVLADLSGESFASTVQDAYKKMVYDVNENKEQKLYGVPYATNASGILYNEDIFKKYGISVPTTWTALIAGCKKLKAAGVTPFEFTFKDAWTSLCPWNSMAPDLVDSSFYSDKMDGKTTFASTHTTVAQKYLELLQYGQKDFMGTTYDDGNKAFAQGKAAMMINGNWAIPEFKKTNAGINVNLFALPASDDSSKNYVTSGVDVLLTVSKFSKNIATAKDFVSFLLQSDNAKKYIDEQDAFSAVKGVEQGDKTVAGIKDDIASGNVANFPDHYYPSGFDLSSLLQNFAKNEVSGMDSSKNIADLLKNCDSKYDASK